MSDELHTKKEEISLRDSLSPKKEKLERKLSTKETT